MVALCVLGFPHATEAKPDTPYSLEAKYSSIQIEEGNWDAFNRTQINKLIEEHGRNSPTYNPQKSPYAVFDFDNTTLFLDIAEALLAYQIENLKFAMTPEQLDKAIRLNIADSVFKETYNNAEGRRITIDVLAKDIVKAYRWIDKNYAGMSGDKPLSEIKESLHYKDFAAKLRFAYEAIGGSFDHAVSYPWVTYLYTGFTEKEICRLTAETMMWQLQQPIGMVTWESPAELPGNAGGVRVSWKNGARLVPEMQDLYAKFREAGIEVYVCSASFVDVIKEMTSNPAFGYNNFDDKVFAMELERDAKGIAQTEFRRGYDQTQGAGKSATIKRFLVSHYGYGPLFIAGDSEGDQNMLQDFPDMKLGLIINRLRSPDSDIGKLAEQAVASYGNPDAKYLLQGRNDNTGRFVKSQEHFPLGSTEGKKLR